ncbi:MAG TPA: hypothetical protein VJP79_01365 [Nitrososphaera sp.]|nr:hypothetical protein [Nitrososphaera sp.]
MTAAVVAVLLASSSGVAGQARAAQIDASLIPEFDRAGGTFTGTKFIQVTYQPGSAVSELFDGKTERIEFSVNGTDSKGMAGLVALVNAALIKAESPAQVTGANITYSGVLKGGPDRLTLTYRVSLIQSFSAYKLDPSASDGIPMDVNWRGFVVGGAVPIESPKHGTINVNQPIGLLEATFPELAGQLMSTGAKDIMSEPILDFQEIGDMPLDRWHTLFDPTMSLVSTSGVLSGDIGSAKVLSVYSLGECSIREGCPPPKEGDAAVSVGGSDLKVHISTPQPNSQIEIAGFTSIESAGGHQILRVRMDDPSFGIPGFTIQVLLVFGGMMGAIAVVVLWKTRK